MKSIATFLEEILEELHRYANPQRKELAKTYYPTKMEVIGVINPDLKTILKKLRTELKEAPMEFKFQLMNTLIQTNIFECQQLAYEYIGKDKTIVSKLTKENIIQLDHNQDNWVSVDTFSAYILGVAWRLNILDDSFILSKAESSNHWIRRQALVATLGWNQKARGGTGNTEKTLMICTIFVDDHQDMINKALSWALRELTKTDRSAVIHFMEYFDERLHSRVRKEVWNKLNTGLKNPV